MKPMSWQPGMSPEEEANVAYWERNMLALWMATYSNKAFKEYRDYLKLVGHWDSDQEAKYGDTLPSGWYKHEGEGFEGWSRVISVFDGKATFHVPDDFDLGDLPEIKPNWDGHSTVEKWDKVMKQCGIVL